MMTASLMLAALVIESAIGWPTWLYRLIKHPVVWIGALVSALDYRLNRAAANPTVPLAAGALTTVIVVAITTAIALLISHALPNTPWGYTIEAVIAASLVAARSLYVHVAAVKNALGIEGHSENPLSEARQAVGQIVGRDPAKLSQAAIVRASLESLAENASDGVIAPLFWGVVFGLPGIAAYKAINTLDSMIGHRNEKYEYFGKASAYLDDLVNWVPARLTGFMFALVSGRQAAFSAMFRDARLHRSPNAGWPESALAGGLGVRLSGPRSYAGETTNEPWVNRNCPDPDENSLKRGLNLYVRMVLLTALVLLSLIIGGVFE